MLFRREGINMRSILENVGMLTYLLARISTRLKQILFTLTRYYRGLRIYEYVRSIRKELLSSYSLSNAIFIWLTGLLLKLG